MSAALDPSPSLLVRASIVHHMQNAPSGSGRHLSDGLHRLSGAQSKQDAPSPSATHGASNSNDTQMSLHGPQALSSTSSSTIPNFPSTTQLRSPPPPIANTPSPTDTPLFTATNTNTTTTSTTSTVSSSASSISQPASFAQSPWHALAASGGAMTPSLEGPTLAPRGSPQLGRPFEKLNLGSTWSGSNLRESTESSSPPPRGGGRPVVPRGPVTGNGAAVAAASPQQSLQAPIALSSLAQRRALGSSMNLGPLRGGDGGSGQPVTSSPLSGSVSGSGSRSSMSSTSAPLSSSSASSSSRPVASTSTSTSRLRPLAPSDLPELVASDSTLILDIRPPSSFQESHVPNAHSIPVPSTLLRRPNFGISKLCQMLDAPSRDAVGHWRDKADIVLIDQDSTVALDGCVLSGLTGKFEREGYTGKLWFVAGGQAAVEDQECVECVCEESPSDANPTPSSEGSASLGIGRLPRLAFQHSSTGVRRATAGGAFTSAATHRSDPFQSFSLGGSAPVTGQQRRFSRSTESSRNRLQPANPFFDNIRQNLELSHGGITERISLALPEEVMRRANELPPFLRNLVTMKDTESQDLLANQFYRIERGEQKRLQGIMDVLTKGTCTPAARSSLPDEVIRSADDIEHLMNTNADPSTYFPFSITAGVERGAKNRYKNIWPYDFSRVRLGTPTEDNSDYINASFVQPRGTTRRYIATQGPLDATYCDFWTLVWEQNVRVIVMLTKQFEGGLLKCGNYWQEQQYGDLRLRLVSHFGGEDEAEQGQTTGFDFGSAGLAPNQKGTSHGNIRRTFHLSHDKHPDQEARVITQVQCIDWPDFDVPETPEVLLNLMKDVDSAVAETGLEGSGEDRCTFPPVLVHCSAGVGRTGSYILVDAIADGLRREVRNHSGSGGAKVEGAAAPAEPAPVPKPSVESGKSVSFFDGPTNRVLDKMDVDSVTTAPMVMSPSALPEEEPESPGLEDPEKPRPVTQSHKRHRAATPLSAMDEPILEVLQGMRVQRMSLVQSLRQYLFVHRAIITYYLELLDEEAHRSSLTSNSTASTSRSSGPATSQTAETSVSSTDDEAHIKRKPSSADLQPEADLRLQSIDDIRLSEGSGGADLAKRASFKKRRGPDVAGTQRSSSGAAGGASSSPPTLPTSSLPGSRRGRSSRGE